MWRNVLYFVGRTLFLLTWVAAAFGLVLAYGMSAPLLALYLVLILAVAASVVPHELGHALACWAVDAEVTDFQIGDGRRAIRFRVRAVQVSLGWPYRGRVVYRGAVSVGLRAVITLAGSVTNVGLAVLMLLYVRLAVPGPGSAHALLMTAAVGLGVPGLGNLLPFRTRSGELSDGARLLQLRSDVAAEKARQAYPRASALLQAGRAAELLDLHEGLAFPARRMGAGQANWLLQVEFTVAHLPALPAQHRSLAERRVAALLPGLPRGRAGFVAYLTLALLRLRQAGPEGQAEAERLGDQALAATGVSDNLRLSAFAAVVASRQSRGMPYGDVLARAAAASSAETGPEVEHRAAEYRAIADPAVVQAGTCWQIRSR